MYLSQGDFVLTPDKACIIAYGRRCIVRSHVGDLPSNAFAYIRDPDGLDRLKMLAKQTLKDGAKTIRLEPDTTLLHPGPTSGPSGSKWSTISTSRVSRGL